jgi:hypothetical protein
MKHTDLRTGNLIEYKGEDYVVTSINSEHGTIRIVPEKHLSKPLEFGIVINLTDANPITLTEQWLVKCGFIVEEGDPRYNRYYKHIIFDFGIQMDTKGWIEAYINDGEGWIDNKIPFVNILQNVFYFTMGNELEIKN